MIKTHVHTRDNPSTELPESSFTGQLQPMTFLHSSLQRPRTRGSGAGNAADRYAAASRCRVNITIDDRRASEISVRANANTFTVERLDAPSLSSLSDGF